MPTGQNIQQLNMDLGPYLQKVRELIQSLTQQKVSVRKLQEEYVRLNKEGKIVSVGIRAVDSAGKQYVATMKNMGQASAKTAADVQVTGVRVKETAKAIQQQAAAQQRLQSVSRLTGTLVGKTFNLQSSGISANLQSQIQRAQQQLSKIFAEDPKLVDNAYRSILNRLRQGIVDVETGTRGRLQKALIDLLKIEERITKEKIKQKRQVDEQARKEQDLQQIQAQKAGRLTVGQQFVGGINRQLGVPAGADISSINRFQQSLVRLSNIAAKSGLSLNELRRRFAELRSSPSTVTTSQSKEMQQLDGAIRSVISSYDNMRKVSSKAESNFGRLTLSMAGLLRVLQIQLIHRFFGSLITQTQQAIQSSAELQFHISEIRTITQGSGITFNELSSTIQRLATEFNRTQADVAEAAYEAFSNQIIETREDLILLEDSLRLARITTASATEAVNIMSSAFNAYNLSVAEGELVTAAFFRAVDLGRFRIGDIANTLGRTSVAASQLGLVLQEQLAFLTTTTRRGVPVAEAQTQLSSLLQNLLKPSEELQRIFEERGFANIEQLIGQRGFVGVLNLLSEAAEKGSDRLAELVPRIRALRGAFGATGQGLQEFESDLSQLNNALQETRRAQEIVNESAGEQFRIELNATKVFFEETASGIIVAVQRLAKPFGGIKQIVIDAVNVIRDLVTVLKSPLELLSSLSEASGGFLLNLRALGLAFITYKVSALSLGRVNNTLKNVWDGTTSAVKNFRLGIGSIDRTILNYSATTDQAAIATARMKAQIEQTRARFASFGAALANIALIAAPIIITQFEAEINSFLGTIKNFVTETDVVIERTRKQGEDVIRALRDQDNVALREFQDNVRERFAPYQERIRQLNVILRAFVREQRDEFERLNDILKRNADTILNSIKEIVGDLSRSVNQAKSDIENSLKRVSEFADRNRTELFQQALGFANTPGLFPNENADAQLSLIRNRVEVLQGEIRDLIRQGDRESIESARRRFEEIRRLTIQQFTIDVERRRQNVNLGLERPDEVRFGPNGRVNIVRANIGILQEQLETLTEQEEAAESAFRERQERERILNREALRFERDREEAIKDATEALIRFNLVNEQGRLRPEFRGEGGKARALARFQELVQAARDSLQPIELTTRQLQELQQRVGVEGARIIQDRLRNHRIAREEIIELERSIRDQQIHLSRQAEREITAEQNRELANRTLQEREALQRQQAEALSTRQAANRRINSIIARLQREVQGIPIAAANELGLFAGARTEQLQARSRESIRALEVLSQERTPEAERAVREAVGSLGAQLEVWLRENIGDRTISATGRTGNEEATRIRRTLISETNALIQAVGAISDADRQINQSQQALDRLSGRLNDLPAQLQAVLRTNDIAENTRQANTHLVSIAQAIDNLTLATAGLSSQGFATGGLIGGTFNSRGPDNRIAAVRTGEYVINPESTRKFFPQIEAINAGRIPSFADGGLVSNTTNVGDITINVQGSKSPEETARAVMGRISREMRRKNV